MISMSGSANQHLMLFYLVFYNEVIQPTRSSDRHVMRRHLLKSSTHKRNSVSTAKIGKVKQHIQRISKPPHSRVLRITHQQHIFRILLRHLKMSNRNRKSAFRRRCIVFQYTGHPGFFLGIR